MPDGTRLKQAKLRGIVSEGMILAESELEIGAGGDQVKGIMVARRDAASTRSSPPGTPLADVLPISDGGDRARDHARTGPTAWASTGSPASCTRRPAPSGRRRHGSRTPGRPASPCGRDGAGSTAPTCARASPRRVFEDVTIGPSPLVAEGAADGRRAAPDQQRRRHHQLRDAPDRAAAARLRPRSGRRRRARRAARAGRASRCRRSTGRPARSTPRWS